MHDTKESAVFPWVIDYQLKKHDWEDLWITIVTKLKVVIKEKYANKCVISLVGVDKTLDKKTLREKGFIFIYGLKGYSPSLQESMKVGVWESSTSNPPLRDR